MDTAPEPEHEPTDRPSPKERVDTIVRKFEQGVVLFLMGLLMLVVMLTTVELGWMVVRDMGSVSELLLDEEEMFELFGFFLLVLIGMELLVTLKTFLYEKVIHVEVVLEVSLIAVAQKLIVSNLPRTGAAMLAGFGALVLALAVAFWLVRNSRRRARRGL